MPHSLSTWKIINQMENIFPGFRCFQPGLDEVYFWIVVTCCKWVGWCHRIHGKKRYLYLLICHTVQINHSCGRSLSRSSFFGGSTGHPCTQPLTHAVSVSGPAETAQSTTAIVWSRNEPCEEERLWRSQASWISASRTGSLRNPCLSHGCLDQKFLVEWTKIHSAKNTYRFKDTKHKERNRNETVPILSSFL